MEIYAAMVEYKDMEIGRLVSYLESIDDFKLPFLTRHGHEVMIYWSDFPVKNRNGKIGDIGLVGKKITKPKEVIPIDTIDSYPSRKKFSLSEKKKEYDIVFEFGNKKIWFKRHNKKPNLKLNSLKIKMPSHENKSKYEQNKDIIKDEAETKGNKLIQHENKIEVKKDKLTSSTTEEIKPEKTNLLNKFIPLSHKKTDEETSLEKNDVLLNQALDAIKSLIMQFQ